MIVFRQCNGSTETDANADQLKARSVGRWCPGRRSSYGQTIIAMIIAVSDHGLDLRFWVELRGFEPMTPSMRKGSGPSDYQRRF
jgi:hypothetical protein